MEFELAEYDVAIQHVNHHAMGLLPYISIYQEADNIQ